MLLYVMQGLGYGFTAAIQPGPLQTFVVSQTLERGWRRALPAALAPLISDGPIILLTLLVLSRIPAWAQRALYIVGGLFVLYLAWGAYASWRAFDPEKRPAAPTGQNLFRAALINALSPNPYIYWSLVTGPIVIAGWRQSPILGIGFVGGFYAAVIVTQVLIVGLFSGARKLGPKVNRVLLGGSTFVLLGFGLYQLWLGIAGSPQA